MRLGTRREGRDLLVPDVDPHDLALAPQRVGQPIQAVTDDAVDALHAPCGENLRELVRDGFGHVSSPLRCSSAKLERTAGIDLSHRGQTCSYAVRSRP